MTPSNTHPGTAARGLQRAFLQTASDLLTARDRRRSSDRTRARPRLEGLEDRCLLSPTITEFPVPTANSGPYGITAGPDGNLWFTESGGGQIGRITPAAHAITEFPIPTANAGPRGITAGPDGNLWFTEYTATRSGGSPRRPTPSPSSPSPPPAPVPMRDHGRPRRQPLVHRVRRQPDRADHPGDPRHHRVPCPLPPAPSPFGITAGPDGNLWFTEVAGNQIGRITPASHAITEFPVSPPACRSPTGSRRAPTATSGSPRVRWRPDRRDHPDDPRHHRVPVPTAR